MPHSTIYISTEIVRLPSSRKMEPIFLTTSFSLALKNIRRLRKQTLRKTMLMPMILSQVLLAFQLGDNIHTYRRSIYSSVFDFWDHHREMIKLSYKLVYLIMGLLSSNFMHLLAKQLEFSPDSKVSAEISLILNNSHVFQGYFQVRLFGILHYAIDLAWIKSKSRCQRKGSRDAEMHHFCALIILSLLRETNGAALAVWLAFLAWAPYNLVLKAKKRSPCTLTFFLLLLTFCTWHSLLTVMIMNRVLIMCIVEAMESESYVLVEKSLCLIGSGGIFIFNVRSGMKFWSKLLRVVKNMRKKKWEERFLHHV